MIENSQILENVGKSKTQKLIDEIHSKYFELKEKKFPVSKNYINDTCIITATKDKEIKSIGMSCINDLLTDNFGKFFQGAYFRNGGALGLIDNVGSLQTVDFIGNPPFTARYNANNSVSLGTRFQIGSGTTPADRADFRIETAFANGGLEDNQTNTGSGAYTAGLSRINVAGVISPTTGTGSISEFVMLAIWQKFPQQSQTKVYCLSRINISPVVAFGVADTINIDYAIQI